MDCGTATLIESVNGIWEKHPECFKLACLYIYMSRFGDPRILEFMTGTEAMAFEVKRNMDRLPGFLDPEVQLKPTGRLHGRVGS